ncbi:neural-cadherin [Caerostris extrusa]|uniref:Neural-cadherin n=1 Tax=Caerostris extrusa TaxID=172846 RepID=A0AAV4P539_CAEEX|nr:neural-cadherin [Caerostris extrusa]
MSVPTMQTGTNHDAGTEDLQAEHQDSGHVQTPRVSAPFSVYIEVYSEELLPEDEIDQTLENNQILPVRQKRSVRPTKSYEYKETDGSKPGKVMFQLDKKHPQETYKMEGPVKWVEVDSSGDVRVKEPWDYEQLGKEKTIDFWVFVTGPNINGESSSLLLIPCDSLKPSLKKITNKVS